MVNWNSPARPGLRFLSTEVHCLSFQRVFYLPECVGTGENRAQNQGWSHPRSQPLPRRWAWSWGGGGAAAFVGARAHAPPSAFPAPRNWVVQTTPFNRSLLSDSSVASSLILYLEVRGHWEFWGAQGDLGLKWSFARRCGNVIESGLCTAVGTWPWCSSGSNSHPVTRQQLPQGHEQSCSAIGQGCSAASKWAALSGPLSQPSGEQWSSGWALR